MIRGFQCTDRCFQNCRHFFVRHFFVVPKIENRALFIGQSGNRLNQTGLDFVAVKKRIRLELICQIDIIGVVNRRSFFAVSVVQKRNRLVCRNPIKPRKEFRFAFKTFNTSKNFDKNVLNHIICIVVVIDQTADVAIQRLLKSLHQYPKPLLMGRGHGEHFYDVVVWILFLHVFKWIWI